MPSLGRRLLVSGLLGGGCFTATRRPGSASDVAALYEADDGSVAFALPQGWIGVTLPEQLVSAGPVGRQIFRVDVRV